MEKKTSKVGVVVRRTRGDFVCHSSYQRWVRVLWGRGVRGKKAMCVTFIQSLLLLTGSLALRSHDPFLRGLLCPTGQDFVK